MASSTVDARLDEYFKQAKCSFAQPMHCSKLAYDASEVFSQVSQCVPPASLNPPGPTSTRRQTKIPHFFPGWRPKLPNLPLDVLLEIASHMLPLDLLNCSRTSKAFRSALMSRSSRSVWMTVLRSLPDFPPCPEDMSEPVYVALVFDDNCFSCGEGKAYYVDYVLRIRLCSECWGKYVRPGTDLLHDLPDIVCDVVTMLVPTFDYDCSVVDNGKFWAHHLHPVSHIRQDLYYRPELEKMIRFCWPPPFPTVLEMLRPALLQRVEYLIQRHIHAVQLYWWLDLAMIRSPSNVEEAARDCADVMQDIREQKYLLPYQPFVDENDEEPVKNEPYDPNLCTRAELIRSCGAVSPYQYFEESERREACDTTVRDACLAARRTEFRDWYEHMVANHAASYDRRMLPNRRDGGSIFDLLAWENEARVPIDEETFYSYVANIPALLDSTIRNTMRCLAALVPYDWRIRAGMDSKFVNTVGGLDMDVLALARPDALFVCRECGAGACGLPWPEIHGHWRERHPHLSFWGEKDLGCPGERPRVRLWKEGREVVQAILDEAGLQTGLGRERMDRLVRTGRLYCACGDPELAGPGDLDWAKFVQHVWTHRETHRARCLAAYDLTNPPPYDRTWIHNYSFGPSITYLPKGADTTAAFSHCRADSRTRATIGAVLARCPEEWSLICAVCDKLSTDKHGGWKDASLGIPKSIHAVAYHMEAKHGRPFADGDISFCRKLSRRRDLPW